MKSAFEKKLNYIAAGIFLIGLIANVSLSITDPFIFVDTDVISRASGSSGSGSSSSSGPMGYQLKTETSGHAKGTDGTCTVEYDFEQTQCFGTGSVSCSPSYIESNCQDSGCAPGQGC